MADRPAVVLIDGDDPSLVSDAVAAAVAELLGDADRSLSLEDVRGEEVDLAAVADSCATPPFLSDRRVVLVRDVGRLASRGGRTPARLPRGSARRPRSCSRRRRSDVPPKLAAAAKALAASSGHEWRFAKRTRG